MSDKEVKKPEKPERRHFLEAITGVVATAGVGGAAWPFITSMNPSTDVLEKSTTEVDLGKITTGETKTVAWQGKPIFIFHRKEQEIADARKSTGSEKDPEEDEKRVQRPEWLVVIGICTHLGCVPSRKEKGWFCPCHGSVYDNSGRILSGPAPKNLYLPPYEFLSDSRILIGEKVEKVEKEEKEG